MDAEELLTSGDPQGAYFLADDDMQPAFQGIVGLSYPINPQWSVSGDYRYFATLDPRFTDNTGGQRDSQYRTHNLLLSVTYHFGAAPPAPAPTPAAAPPPPPPAAAPQPAQAPAVPRTYLVFFDFDKSDITAEAARVLKDAAENAKKSGVSRIMVTGHTDTVGTAPYNQRLSERRAAAVRDFLVKEGLTQGQISTVGRGKSEPLVPTGDGVREPRNRRAEIVFP